MRLLEAQKRAEEEEEVKKIIEGGGFICSAFVMLGEGEDIEEWNLGFYSSDREEITAVKVVDDEVELGITDEPLRSTSTEIHPENAAVSARKALEMSKEVLDEEGGGSYKKILFSMKSGEDEDIWSAAFIGGLKIFLVEIGSESGDVLKKEESRIGERGPSMAG